MINETDKAYAAGILDGEGSVMWAHGSLKVSVTMSKPDVVEWFSEKFGGTVLESKSKWGPMYNWTIYCSTCRPFLEAVRPYVVLKQNQVNLGISIVSTYRKQGDGHRGLSRNEEDEWNKALMYRMRLAELLTEANARRAPLVKTTKLTSVEVLRGDN